jgi:hypothetical protein
MLGDQRSPYVGRFARGWHRLPGWIPGQPQTRTGARSSIGTPLRASRTPRRGRPVREGPTCGEQVDLPGAGVDERCGAGRCGGAGGEHVVDEQEPGWGGAARDPGEGAPHRPQALLATAASLRGGGPGPADVGGRREPELACERPREHASLIEPALGPPPGRERDPRHGIGRRRAEGREGPGERLPDASPAGELQTMDGGAGRTSIRERRPRGGDGLRRTVAAPVDRLRGRPSAAPAPRRPQRLERLDADRTERPRARATPGTGPWEQEVHGPIEHRVTLRGAPDTHQGRGTSTGCPAPLTAIVSTLCVFRTG